MLVSQAGRSADKNLVVKVFLELNFNGHYHCLKIFSFDNIVPIVHIVISLTNSIVRLVVLVHFGTPYISLLSSILISLIIQFYMNVSLHTPIYTCTYI